MKFSEMTYTRPDINALLARCKQLAAKAADAQDGDALIQVYYEQSRAFADYTTASQLANIHYTCDTRDAYWKAEQDFFDANGPAVTNASVEISRAFLANPYVDALTEHFGTTCVAGMKNAVLGMDDRTVELQQEFNALVSQYQQIYGGALVELDGKQLLAAMERRDTLAAALEELAEEQEHEHHHHDDDECGCGCHEQDHDHDHDHDEENNPHVWLSVENAIKQVENIENKLIEYNSINKDKYSKNAKEYIEQLSNLDNKIHSELDNIKIKIIVTYNEDLHYFDKDFGINIVGVVQREAGSEPSAKELQETIEKIKKLDVKAICVEPQYSTKAAETISKETNVKVYTLDPIVTEESKNSSYIDIMNKNLETLKEAFK